MRMRALVGTQWTLNLVDANMNHSLAYVMLDSAWYICVMYKVSSGSVGFIILRQLELTLVYSLGGATRTHTNLDYCLQSSLVIRIANHKSS